MKDADLRNAKQVVSHHFVIPEIETATDERAATLIKSALSRRNVKHAMMEMRNPRVFLGGKYQRLERTFPIAVIYGNFNGRDSICYPRLDPENGAALELMPGYTIDQAWIMVTAEWVKKVNQTLERLLLGASIEEATNGEELRSDDGQGNEKQLQRNETGDGE